MQAQHISDLYPNMISITEFRRDIDVLLDLLQKYPEVRVLRGQKILFNITRPGNGQAKRDKIAAAAEYFQTASRQLKSANKVSAADWLIKEREKMRSKRYYS